MTAKFIRNAHECPTCHDVVESKHDHDMRWCKCGEIFVDGGLSYIRVGFKDAPPIDRCAWDFGNPTVPCCQCGEAFDSHHPETGRPLNPHTENHVFDDGASS